jgi:RNA polymerase sigma-70 factor, ECF subfamily
MVIVTTASPTKPARLSRTCWPRAFVGTGPARSPATKVCALGDSLRFPEDAGTTLAIVDTGDGVLVARLAAGDEEALAEIFDRHAPFVFGLARRVTGERNSAEDVVQEVFTTLWSHPERFDPARGTLRSFLGVQAHRRAVDAVRRDVRRNTHENRLQALNPTPTATYDDETDSLGSVELVRQAIGRLPVAQRRAVELAYYEGFTQREVAGVLGIPEGTAKSRLRLAQAKLAEWLAPHLLEMT